MDDTAAVTAHDIESRPDLESELRRRGHRVTDQRRVVWEVLTSATHHLTADDVIDAARARHLHINRASVYRTLTLLSDLGLARETSLGADSQASRWEVAHPDDHFHLICRSCGDVQHHAGDLVEQVRSHLGADHHFVAEQIELTVRGLCERCRERSG